MSFIIVHFRALYYKTETQIKWKILPSLSSKNTNLIQKTTRSNKIFIFDNYMTSDVPRGDQDSTESCHKIKTVGEKKVTRVGSRNSMFNLKTPQH